MVPLAAQAVAQAVVAQAVQAAAHQAHQAPPALAEVVGVAALQDRAEARDQVRLLEGGAFQALQALQARLARTHRLQAPLDQAVQVEVEEEAQGVARRGRVVEIPALGGFSLMGRWCSLLAGWHSEWGWGLEGCCSLFDVFFGGLRQWGRRGEVVEMGMTTK